MKDKFQKGEKLLLLLLYFFGEEECFDSSDNLQCNEQMKRFYPLCFIILNNLVKIYCNIFQNYQRYKEFFFFKLQGSSIPPPPLAPLCLCSCNIKIKI